MNNIIFCTVNAGTNIFTNITVKSILKFYPTAKIFIIDALTKSGNKFEPIDDDIMKNIEVIVGIDRKDTTLPIIDIMQAKNISLEEKNIVISKLGSNPYAIKFRGSFNHSENVQLAINTIAENFILMDCDAPLIHPLDFSLQTNAITIAQVQTRNADKEGYCLLTPIFKRFIPFIQFINVQEMNRNNVIYYDPNKLVDMLDIAMRYNQTLWFDTGCIFFDQVFKKQLNFKEIKYSNYVDHFGSGTYSNKPKDSFYKKYSNMFKNPICA